MLTLVLASALAQNQTVTFSHPCANAAVVIEALGREAGVKMSVGGSVNRDYIAVRFRDKDLGTIKRVIAETINAEWVQRGETLVLDRGPRLERAEQEALDITLRREIEKYLLENPAKAWDVENFEKRILEAAAAGGGEDGNSAQMQALRKHTPDIHWNPQIVHALGAKWLSTIEDGGTVEFKLSSDGSTDMPAALAKAISEYLADCDKAREIATPLGLTLTNLPAGPKPASPLKVRIHRNGTSLTVSMILGDMVVLGGPVQTYFQIAMVGWRKPINEKPPHGSLTGKLTLDEPLKSLLRVASAKIRRSTDGVEPLTLAEREAAVSHAADLQKSELLGNLGTIPLEQASQRLAYEYVALVDDRQVLFGRWMLIAETATLDQVWQSWGEGLAVAVDEETGILKIGPMDRRRARESRFNRDAAERFAASFASSGRVTLESAAELALQSDSESGFGYNSAAACLLLPASQPVGNWAALRAYGSLNAGQRRQAERGGVVFAWGDLPRTAREAIQSQLARGSSMFADEPPEPVRWHTFSVTYRGRNIRASEALSAIPADTVVRIMCWRTTGLMPKQPLPENDFGVYTPEMIAKFGPMGPLRSEGDLAPSKADSAPLAVIDAERIQLEVYIPGIGYTAFAAHVSSQTDLTEFFAIDKLPEPWRTELAEAIKKNGGGAR